ncbi:MAG TPA: TetR/AcrR family transcriptional regulator [Ktedonobacterales bacterium]|nr:TetR/AcrR family transcriptional regulator [Ktedonobacterales bacterium]
MATTPHTKRQEQALARRRQLIHTALLLFSEKGYRGTSVRDIARTAGVNEGLLYHYFSSKADLFRAVLDEYAPIGAFSAFPAPEANPQPGEYAFDKALLAFGQEFAARIREYRTFIVTMLTEAPSDPELGGILSEFLRATQSNMTRFLASYREAGQINPQVPIEIAAHVLQGSLMLHILMEVLRAPTAASDGDRALSDIVSVLLLGLAPR